MQTYLDLQKVFLMTIRIDSLDFASGYLFNPLRVRVSERRWEMLFSFFFFLSIYQREREERFLLSARAMDKVDRNCAKFSTKPETRAPVRTVPKPRTTSRTGSEHKAVVLTISYSSRSQDFMHTHAAHVDRRRLISISAVQVLAPHVMRSVIPNWHWMMLINIRLVPNNEYYIKIGY